MNLVERVRNILLAPSMEWETIKNETHPISDLFIHYAMILAAIPALASLIGFSIIGYSHGFTTFRMPLGSGITYGILTYLSSLIGVYLLAMVIDLLSPNFEASKNMHEAVKISVYSMTPAWIGGIFLAIPPLAIISMIAGLYGLYLLFLGIKQVKDVPPEKQLSFFIIVVLVAIVIQIILYTVVRSLAFRGPMVM